ncbi:NPP1 family protein [Apilactobacillus xinyiensis]|uniref:NPP1 family protein n=1 Tax=Apilactobacillus xinyiensis TaxID=2841032 RepID=UPI00200D4F35|nr:NPP1 family protein [Apilactobacillus xinyiensis]MCL0330678.1 NPP1 family protein [Apilactobacillus xinyiensis]
MKLKKYLLASAATGMLALSLNAVSTNAKVINHDQVVGFKEVNPSNLTERIEKQYKPYLQVLSGAVPFPAVNANGDTSGGLQASGDPHGHASQSVGQVYARSGWYQGKWAIMYSWYFPKDEPDTHIGGHRHDWENIVVWLDNPSNKNPKVLKISYSAHGGYKSYGYSDKTFRGNNPLVAYGNTTSLGIMDHSLMPAYNQVGGQQPLIDWNDLTPAARNALTNTDFGKANVPFKDGSFENNLNKSLKTW